MTRLILEIREYPKEEKIDEDDLSLEGREIVIRECKDMIERLINT